MRSSMVAAPSHREFGCSRVVKSERKIIGLGCVAHIGRGFEGQHKRSQWRTN